MALLTVVGSMLVLSLFLMIGLTTVVRGISESRASQDDDTATASGQAGVDYVLQHMNIDSNFLGASGLDVWSAYQQVAGTGGTDARYRYKVISVQGAEVLIQIEGTSSVGGATTGKPQTLFATLRMRGFLSYVYFSDVEVIDPELVGDNAACGNYYYTGRSSRSDCAEIQWASGDVVNGPLHSNDALQINGTVQFKDADTTTAWPTAVGRTGLTNASKTWWGTQGAPLPGGSFPPKWNEKLDLPTTNDSLLDNVEPNVNGVTSTTRVGCYYQGATRIIFQGTTMKVLSPSTTRSDTPARCYNRSTPGAEQTVTIPPVIFVDSTTASCSLRNTGYPLSSEDYTSGSNTATSWGTGPNYSCKRGTVYLQGTADAQVTVSSVDDTVITGNLMVQDNSAASSDVIGVIGGNNIWVYNPLDGGNNMTSTSPLGGSRPPAQRVNTIQAGMLAIRHSFLVQNWNDGNTLGTLNVKGAVGQKFRGPVGTGNSSGPVTGYLKNYVYDPRLAYLRPPHFLEPANTWDLVKTVGK